MRYSAHAVLSLVLFVATCGLLLRASGVCAGSGELPDGFNWREVDGNDRAAILELLAAHTKGNYERIRTWTGTYSVEMETYLSTAFVVDAFRDRMQKESLSAMMQKTDFDATFAIDLLQGNLFTAKDTRSLTFLTLPTRQPIAIPGTGSVDKRSIVTSEAYIYFPPKDNVGSFAVLPDHPEALDKPAAHRVSVELSQRNEHGDLVDPRTFFGTSGTKRFWEELNQYLRVLRGEKGVELQEQLNRSLAVDEASKSGSVWYRMRLTLGAGVGTPATQATSIWSADAGFNPISVVFEDKQSGSEPLKIVEWKWTNTDGIYVPAHMKEVWRSQQPRIVTYQREVTLKQSTLNHALPPYQFDYQGLGLKKGDLILDEIKKVVYIMDDGHPVKLANFGDEYVPPEVKGQLLRRAMFIIGNVVVIAILAAMYIRKRRAKLSGT